MLLINTSHGIGIESFYPYFPAYTEARSRIPIENKFIVDIPLCNDNIKSKLCGDFHIVLYYISKQFGEAYIRRLDERGWDFDFDIKVFGHKNESNPAIIHVGKNADSSMILSFNASTNIELKRDVSIWNTQLIPKTILQTYYTYKAENIHHWDAFYTFVDLNPEYSIKIMLDSECREFLKNYFPQNVVEAYDSLIPGAFKADLFRYCYLYIFGGCYFDNKMINRIPLRKLIHQNDDFLVCADTNSNGRMANSLQTTSKIYNAMICSVSKDSRLLNTINNVVDNIDTFRYQKSIPHSFYLNFQGDLGLTGPVAFYNSIKNYVNENNVRFKHGYLAYSSFQHVSHHYTDYFVMNKETNEIAFNKAFKDYYSNSHRKQSSYSKLWREGNVFFSDPFVYKNRYRLFIEKKSTREFHFHNLYQLKNNRSALLIQYKRSFLSNLDSFPSTVLSYFSTNINSISSKNEVRKVDVRVKSIRFLDNGQYLNPDCRYNRNWFDETNFVDDIKSTDSNYKGSEKNVSLTIKVIDNSNSDELLLMVNIPKTTNMKFLVELCI